MNGAYGLQLLSPPFGEPLAVADMVGHLRLYLPDVDQGTIAAYISAARDYVETVTKRQILPATWLMTLDLFPGRYLDAALPTGWRFGMIQVPKAPLQTVTGIQYIDTLGVLQTLATDQYQFSTRTEPGRIAPARFKVWPQTDPLSFEAVQITFLAGYVDPIDIPPRLLQAIRYLVGHLYEHREATIEQALTQIPYGLMSYINSCKYKLIT